MPVVMFADMVLLSDVDTVEDDSVLDVFMDGIFDDGSMVDEALEELVYESDEAATLVTN